MGGARARIERPRVLATAARARGLLAADRGDLDGAIASLEGALGHHAGFPVPIERGRTLVALAAHTGEPGDAATLARPSRRR